MKRRLSVVPIFCLVLVLAAGAAFSARTGRDPGQGDFAIYASPNTIAESAPCTWVTIHTEVPYRAVDGVLATVDDKDVDVAFTFPDDRGNLVVKLRFAEVLRIAAPPEATIGLIVAIDDQILRATDTVHVKK